MNPEAWPPVTPHPEQIRMHEAVRLARPPNTPVRGPFYHSNPDTLPFYTLGGLKLSASIDEKADGCLWYQVSYSPKTGGKKIPTHKQTLAVRKAMFRPDSLVIAVFPPANEYVNDHPACLHLWERLEGPRLIPDLREIVRGRFTI